MTNVEANVDGLCWRGILFISNRDSIFLYTFRLTFPISYFLIKKSYRFFKILINLNDFGTNGFFRCKCEQWNWHLNNWFWVNFTPPTIIYNRNWFELNCIFKRLKRLRNIVTELLFWKCQWENHLKLNECMNYPKCMINIW